MSDNQVTPLQRIGSLLSQRLIDALDDLYPHRCPNPKDTEREIWMKAGERRLIDFLEMANRDSAETVLLPSPNGLT